jgi:hypothetical protein
VNQPKPSTQDLVRAGEIGSHRLSMYPTGSDQPARVPQPPVNLFRKLVTRLLASDRELQAMATNEKLAI